MDTPYITKTKVLLVISLVIICIFSFVVNSQGKSYEISNYDINMNLKENGTYIITEKIKYNFKKGSFSEAYRNISGDKFNDIKFISLKGLNTEAQNIKVDKNGNDLDIKWNYPETTNSATFMIKFKAIQALQSKGDKNTINWQPIGTEWDVFVKDIDIQIYFPESINNLDVISGKGLVSKGSSIVKFHQESLKPNQSYFLKLSFDEIIEMGESNQTVYLWSILIGIILGIIVLIYDIMGSFQDKKKREPGSLSISDLSLTEIGGILYRNQSQRKKALLSEVFSLARSGTIKLISKVEKGWFGSKKATVKVKIIAEDNLSEIQQMIIKGLKKHDTLKKFFQDNKISGKVSKEISNKLKRKDIISQANLQIRKRIGIFSVIFFFIPALITGIFALIKSLPILIGFTVFLIVVGIGRLIKIATIPALTKQGLSLEHELNEYLDQKKKELEDEIESDPAQGLAMFFEELPYIILHSDFKKRDLKQYKKEFKIGRASCRERVCVGV